jgi:hypothetical protein
MSRRHFSSTQRISRIPHTFLASAALRNAPEPSSNVMMVPVLSSNLGVTEIPTVKMRVTSGRKRVKSQRQQQ